MGKTTSACEVGFGKVHWLKGVGKEWKEWKESERVVEEGVRKIGR